MLRTKTLTTALIAVFALGLVASATASAEEPTLILPAPTASEPVSFTATSGTGKFVSRNGTELKCKKDKGEGDATSLNSGTFHIDLEECKGPLLTTCTGLGEAPGVLLVLGIFHYWLMKEGSEPLTAGFVYLIEPVHFECGSTLGVIRGCMAGPVNHIEELVSSLENLLKQSGGVNTVTKVTNEKGEEVACILETSVSGGEFQQSGEETHETISGFKQNGSAITALLMN